ncbi:hypothetical protein Tco_0717825 [Tanacetum coccineum]
MSTNSWYPVENHRLPRETVRIRKRSGQAVLGRFIYWVGYERILGDDGNFAKTYVLVSFVLINHHFQVFEIPQQLRDVLPSPIHISQLKSLVVLSRTFSVGDIVKPPEVLIQAKVFKTIGIDPTTYNISFRNGTNVPKQGGVFGDCGI